MSKRETLGLCDKCKTPITLKDEEAGECPGCEVNLTTLEFHRISIKRKYPTIREKVQDGRPLFAADPQGGWWYPTIEEPPGIFIEESHEGESCAWLTEAELFDLVFPLWIELQHRKGSWTKTGFEAGREYGHINIKADYRDFGTVLDYSLWQLGNIAPSDKHKCWAIEFLDKLKGKYARRLFWVPTEFKVPKLGEKGKVIG